MSPRAWQRAEHDPLLLVGPDPGLRPAEELDSQHAQRQVRAQ